MAKRVKVPISSARGRLFELADMVRQSADTVVVLEHRGSPDKVALVREARLNYLEARLAELEKATKKPATLRGSLTIKVSDDELEELLRQIRRDFGASLANKFK